MKTRILFAAALAVVLGLYVYGVNHGWYEWLWHLWFPGQHWLAVHMGINETGPYYAIESGSGSDIQELTMITAAAVFYNAHFACHTTGCWWPGKFPVKDTPYKQCRRCHPLVPNEGPTKDDIHQARRDAQAA